MSSAAESSGGATQRSPEMQAMLAKLSPADRAQLEVTLALEDIKKRMVSGDRQARSQYWRMVFAQDKLSLLMREMKAGSNDPTSGGPLVMDFDGKITFLVYAGLLPGAAIGAMVQGPFGDLIMPPADMVSYLFSLGPQAHVAINHNPLPALDGDEQTIAEPICFAATIWEYERPDFPESLWDAFIAGVAQLRSTVGHERMWSRVAQRNEVFLLTHADSTAPAFIRVGPDTQALLVAPTEAGARAAAPMLKNDAGAPRGAVMSRVAPAALVAAVKSFSTGMAANEQRVAAVVGTKRVLASPLDAALRGLGL